MTTNSDTRPDEGARRDLAWGRNAIAFIRERDLDQAFNDWCGGWPCPVDTAPATEIGRLVSRILEIAPDAGLFAEITLLPAPPTKDQPQ